MAFTAASYFFLPFFVARLAFRGGATLDAVFFAVAAFDFVFGFFAGDFLATTLAFLVPTLAAIFFIMGDALAVFAPPTAADRTFSTVFFIG